MKDGVEVFFHVIEQVYEGRALGSYVVEDLFLVDRYAPNFEPLLDDVAEMFDIFSKFNDKCVINNPAQGEMDEVVAVALEEKLRQSGHLVDSNFTQPYIDHQLPYSA